MAEVFSSKPWERKRYTTYETGSVYVSLACPAGFSLSCKPICCDGGLQHLQDPRCQWSVLQGFLNSQISEIAESVLSLNLYPHDMKLQMFLYSIVRCIIPFMLLLLEILYYFVLYRYFFRTSCSAICIHSFRAFPRPPARILASILHLLKVAIARMLTTPGRTNAVNVSPWHLPSPRNLRRPAS